MDTLGSRWKRFVVMVIDPWTLCLIGLTAFLTYAVNQFAGKNEGATIILSTLAAIIASVLGAQFWQQWIEYSGTLTLTSRGKAAVRGLKLLLTRTQALQERVRYLSAKHSAEPLSSEVIETFLDEVCNSCQSLQEQTVNSMENWIDIVPEADVRSQIGAITELNNKLLLALNEKKLLEDRLQEDMGRSEEDTRDLHEQLAEKDQLIIQLQAAHAKYEFDLGSLTASGNQSLCLSGGRYTTGEPKGLIGLGTSLLAKAYLEKAGIKE